MKKVRNKKDANAHFLWVKRTLHRQSPEVSSNFFVYAAKNKTHVHLMV